VKEKSQMKLTVLGTSLMVQSDDKKEQLQAIIDYFEKKIEEVKNKLPKAEPLKIAIIAALNIIDELFKLKADLKQQSARVDTTADEKEVEKITNYMIQKIDSILPGL
jgi:cell division protein ZapA (FtsZ GTPase activity inhibitor)